MKNVILIFLISLSALSFEITTPTLYEGTSYFYQWMKPEQRAEYVQKLNLYKSLKDKGLDVLTPEGEENIWSSVNRGDLSYHFFTVPKAPVEAAFVVQKIKRTEKHFEKGNSEPYKVEVTYLVEAFKTWAGVKAPNDFLNGQIKKADSHWAHYSDLGRRKTKVVEKEFEVGVATISGLAEDVNEWFSEARTSYWGTGYQKENPHYNNVNFTDSAIWNLNVEVNSDNYLIESPELGIYKLN